MRFLRPSAAAVAASGVLLLACSPDRVGGPTLRPGAPSADVTPSAAPVLPQLVITEIMADPTAIADAFGEWIEIYNACPTPVNIQNWKVFSGSGATGTESATITTNVTVPGNGFVLIGNNANLSTNGNVPTAHSWGGSIALANNNTDWVALRMPDGASTFTTIDSVSWNNRAVSPLPSSSPPTAATRYLLNIASDNSYMLGTGANWATTPVGTTYGPNPGDRGTPNGPTTGATYGTLPACGVAPNPVAKVTVSPNPASIAVTKTRAFSASATDEGGTPASTAFTWRSSDPAVVSIDAATGVATAHVIGTATVFAKSENGIEGSADVTVTEANAPATITLSSNDAISLVGYTRPLFYDVKDADGNSVSTTLAWSSSDEAKATIDQRGYVTFKASGSVTFKATAPNGASGSITYSPLDTFTTLPMGLVYRDHVYFGTPSHTGTLDERIVAKRTYVSSWNAARGGPNWVSWNINATHFGSSGRCNCFTADPALPDPVPGIEDFDYRGGGYDRGHMVQSDSRSRNFTENGTTFLMTNILPQAADNNQGPWLAFENFLNAKAQSSGKDVYVVAGGLYGASPKTLKNAGRVQIPDWTWKVAVVVPYGATLTDLKSVNDVEMYAVKMPNDTTTGTPNSIVGLRGAAWQTFETTVDQIEAESGYELFENLPQPIQAILESKDRFPVAVGGTYTAGEGGTVTLNASGSSDPDGDALTYAWDLDNDGTFETAGATASKKFLDNGTYAVSVRVTDPKGAATVGAATVTVGNANPFISSILLDFPVLNRPKAGSTFNVAFKWSDAGVNDALWTYTIDWGDGSAPSTGTKSAQTNIAASHVYAAAGTYSAKIFVTDKDGGQSGKTFQVNVQP